MAVKTSWSSGDVLTAADLTDTFAAKLGTLSVNAQTGTTYTLTTSDPQKVITMTNAAASSVTIPTNATAAIAIGSAVEIVNLSTGVNTTVSAAGGVTFNGGPVVLSPGSSVTLVKIGTDAWMAQGQGSPGLVHIATSTFSAVSSVSVNNCFSSTYDVYRVVVNCTSSAGGIMYLRLRASGSDITASNYSGGTWFWGTSSSGADATGSGTAMSNARISTLATSYATTILDVANPNVAQFTSWFSSLLAADSTIRQSIGGYAATTQADGLTVSASTGNITGRISVFAYRLS